MELGKSEAQTQFLFRKTPAEGIASANPSPAFSFVC